MGRGKRQVSSRKRIKPCDTFSRENAEYKRKQDSSRMNLKGKKPKKLQPGEERTSWRHKFMMEQMELGALPKEERNKRLVGVYFSFMFFNLCVFMRAFSFIYFYFHRKSEQTYSKGRTITSTREGQKRKVGFGIFAFCLRYLLKTFPPIFFIIYF
jgi:hypothetical protein